MSQALQLVNETPREVTELRFTDEQLQLLKNTIAKGTTDDQFRLFTEVAQRTGLNPFAKQIYAVVRQGQMTVQTGVDGYRLIAQRTGQYAGQRGPEWCGADGEWRDVWLDDLPPKAARVGVLRHGFLEPVWGVALTRSYQQPQSPLWKTMPEVMIAKCAEVLALRKAFPQELSGLYADEEMHQADSEPMRREIQQPRRRSQPREPRSVDVVTGEVIEPEVERDGARAPSVDLKELAQLLSDAALSMHDLEPQLGPVTRETARNAITAWLIANPGKTVRDLVANAVPSAESEPAEQAAFA